MICPVCGKQLPDVPKFCIYCGTNLDRESQAPTSYPFTVPPAPPTNPRRDAPPSPPTRKTHVGLWLGLGAAIVFIAAVLVMLFSGVFQSDAQKVLVAAGKSYQAYADAYGQLIEYDFSSYLNGDPYSQKMAFTVDSIEGDPSLSGVGLRIESDVNVPEQQLAVSLTPFYESADLATVCLGLDKSLLYAGTNDKLFSIDSLTLGRDLLSFYERNGIPTNGKIGELKDLSFNLFELYSQQKALSPNEEVTQIIAEANTALCESLVVEKQGKQQISVNDRKVDATAYSVVLPLDAISKYISALESAAVVTVRNGVSPEKILSDIGLPVDLVSSLLLDEFGLPLENSQDAAVREMELGFEELRALLAEVKLALHADHLRFDVYIQNGYVMCVAFTETIEDLHMTISLQLGGGTRLADDISISLNFRDHGELKLVSTGDHSGSSGTFTDQTTLTLQEEGFSPDTLIFSSFEMDKKSGAFDYKLMLEYTGTLTMKGAMTSSKDSFALYLDEVRILEEYGDIEEEVMCFSADYQLGAYRTPAVNTGNRVSLLSLSVEELDDLFYEMELALDDIIRELTPGYGYDAPELEAPAAEEPVAAEALVEEAAILA